MIKYDFAGDFVAVVRIKKESYEINLNLHKLFNVKRRKYYTDFQRIYVARTVRILKEIIPLCSEQNKREIKAYLKEHCVEWLEEFELLEVRFQLKEAFG